MEPREHVMGASVAGAVDTEGTRFGDRGEEGEETRTRVSGVGGPRGSASWGCGGSGCGRDTDEAPFSRAAWEPSRSVVGFLILTDPEAGGQEGDHPPPLNLLILWVRKLRPRGGAVGPRSHRKSLEKRRPRPRWCAPCRCSPQVLPHHTWPVPGDLGQAPQVPRASVSSA